MSLSVSVDVSGIDEVTTNLQGISDKVKSFVSTFPGQVADEMVQKMQAIAPVDTGYLRDHIVSEDSGDGRATVTSEAEYSIYVEFGTRFMSAQPFFFPVFDEYTVQNIVDSFREQVGL
jgi:HK97 gp10 family phage protein